VVSLRKKRERIPADDRVLGTGDFVKSVVRDADERIRRQIGDDAHEKKGQEFIERACRSENVNPKELRMGSRRGGIGPLRAQIASQLVKQYGLPLAEVARQLGVTTAAIASSLRRKKTKV